MKLWKDYLKRLDSKRDAIKYFMSKTILLGNYIILMKMFTARCYMFAITITVPYFTLFLKPLSKKNIYGLIKVRNFNY